MKVKPLPQVVKGDRDPELMRKLMIPVNSEGIPYKNPEILAECRLCRHTIFKYTDWDFILDGRNGSQPICAMCVHERKTQ